MLTHTKELPNITHFAAVVFKTHSVYHEGDQRSKDAPGHGYPAHTETINAVEYISFGSKQEMEAWVIKTETSKTTQPKYSLIEARPLSAQVTASVAIR